MFLAADWIVGFVDGEGYFHISVNPHPEMSCGYQVLPEFTVVQHSSDVQILYALQEYFKCGVVRVNHGDRMAYRVRSFKHLRNIVLPFFEQNTLHTKKRIAFEKFRETLRMMDSKMHLTLNGIEKIKAIAATMNRKKLIDENFPFTS